jgi:hypothetical protein
MYEIKESCFAKFLYRHFILLSIPLYNKEELLLRENCIQTTTTENLPTLDLKPFTGFPRELEKIK